MWSDRSLAALEASLSARDWDAADKVVMNAAEAAFQHKLDAESAHALLGKLRRSRRFAGVYLIADILDWTGQATARVGRHKVQALIEAGELPRAVAAATALITAYPDDRAEVAEAKGLLGRAYKQDYVNEPKASGAAAAIRAAVAIYREGYEERPAARRWHGINLVALACRARRDRVALDPAVDADRIAEVILEAVQDTEPDVPHWDLATGAEACLALGQVEAALTWLHRYVRARDVGMFELSSTLRQLREVWQIEDDSPLGALTQALQIALLAQEGGGGTITDATRRGLKTRATTTALQHVFAGARPVPITVFRLAVARAGGVCRVENTIGEPCGTGFVVLASEFFPGLGNELLVLTNAHVVGAVAGGALQPTDARLRFLANDGPVLAVAEAVWMSGRHELDAIFLRVPGVPADAKPAPIAPRVPPVFSPEAKRRFYVIGYPGGASAHQLSVSIDDNQQLDWCDPKLHYRTPTEVGSSGSPVFDDQWRLIALHHAGSGAMPRLNGEGTYDANEGIWIHAIAAKTRASGPGYTPEIDEDTSALA